jgi:hypothetical protein
MLMEITQFRLLTELYCNFSYIGYVDYEIAVGNQSIVDVVMQTDVTQLNEVVVTALGVERSAQALNYSVTNVDPGRVWYRSQRDQPRKCAYPVGLQG